MKKKILFVNESLACAGGEKSLLTLLSLLDYNKYDVDLQLISYGNDWDELIDPHVNILPPINYFEQLKKSLKDEFFSIKNSSDIKRIFSRVRFYISSKLNKNHRIQETACNYWLCHKNNIPQNNKAYDIAIGYAQGLPTFYVADKITALRKLCWINAFYEVFPEYASFVERKFDKIDCIVAVTVTAANFLCANFKTLSPKVRIFPDLINADMVRKMSCDSSENIRRPDELTIVTLGRLEWHTKGLDLLLDAAKELHNRGIRFKWYILGRGDAHDRMVEFISSNHLNDTVILAGVKANPYPFLKQADIYVQTSRNEGFGIAIAEARILGIPIVSTAFETVREQLQHEHNALLTGFNGVEIADAICRLHRDKQIYANIQRCLQNTTVDNISRLSEFDKLLQL